MHDRNVGPTVSPRDLQSSSTSKPEGSSPISASSTQHPSPAGLPRGRRFLRPGRVESDRDRREAETALIRELWTRQRDYVASRGVVGAHLDYLEAHFSMSLTLRRRLAMIDWLASRIRPTDRVLEWGCQHAVDSCIYRRRFGPAIELHGCDCVPPDAYKPFYDYSGLRYVEIQHPYLLDYPDGCFDVVTSNGVWEHVYWEQESLREVHRVVKPGGLFLVACLPNRYSYTEAFQRAMGHVAHDRLYTMGSARRALEALGYEVVATEHRLVVPTMLNGFPARLKDLYQKVDAAVWATNNVLERFWPVNRIASNLMLAARKPA